MVYQKPSFSEVPYKRTFYSCAYAFKSYTILRIQVSIE